MPTCDRIFALDRYVAITHALGVGCGTAREAVEAFEHDTAGVYTAIIGHTEYNTLSRQFVIPLSGDSFVCRFSPTGLGGSEHTVICSAGTVTLRWATRQT